MQNRDIVLINSELKRQVALGAIYSIVTGKNDRTLMGDTNYTFRKEMMGVFERLWGVPRPKSNWLNLLFGNSTEHVPMLDLLTWFQLEGHRKEDRSPEALAWDVARYVDVIRDAFYVGYIGRETALNHLRCADDMSRNHFHSWADYAGCFIAYKEAWDDKNLQELEEEMKQINGRTYTQTELYDIYLNQGITPIAKIRAAADFLLQDSSSIWSKVNW